MEMLNFHQINNRSEWKNRHKIDLKSEHLHFEDHLISVHLNLRTFSMNEINDFHC